MEEGGNMEDVKDKVRQMIEGRRMESNLGLAAQLGLSEEAFVRNLLAGMASEVPRDMFEEVVEQMVGWGRLRVVVGSENVIMEVLTRFPRGRRGHGFFNLHDEGCCLGGHLRVSELSSIHLVSQPFMGLETRSVQFFDLSGRCMFKVYLDRDEQRNILRDQLQMFNSLRSRIGRQVGSSS